MIERPLPEIAEKSDLSSIVRQAQRVEYMRLTPWRPTISLDEERRRAFLGEISWGERLNENGERVVSVTLPIRRVHAVQAAITLESADVERILVSERTSMLPFAIGATLIVFLSSMLLTVVIAQPLRRLAAAADRLRISGATRLHLPDVSQAQGRDRRAGAFARSR